MQRIARLTAQEKRNALRKAIKRKCHYDITPGQLEHIIENININRAYCIKTTKDRGKFLNLITQEAVVTSERKNMSYVFYLYGDFQCGYFSKNGEKTYSVPGTLDISQNAAAIKQSIIQKTNCQPIVTYTIVIYQGGIR